MLLKYHTDCILSCSNASPIESPNCCPNTLTKIPQREGYLSLFSHLYFNLPKQFHAVGILPNPPFFPFVLKQRRRTCESLRHLLTAGASDSHRAFASCCAPLLCPSHCPLWLVVVLPLITPLPPVRLHLRLSSVSSHNVRTVSLCYGELLALLVIPTWLLHWFPRFESLSNCVPLAWNLPLSARYLWYVAAPLLVPAWGALVVVAWQGLPGHAHSLTSTHMYGYLLYIHTYDGECEQS